MRVSVDTIDLLQPWCRISIADNFVVANFSMNYIGTHFNISCSSLNIRTAQHSDVEHNYYYFARKFS